MVAIVYPLWHGDRGHIYVNTYIHTYIHTYIYIYVSNIISPLFGAKTYDQNHGQTVVFPNHDDMICIHYTSKCTYQPGCNQPKFGLVE